MPNVGTNFLITFNEVFWHKNCGERLSGESHLSSAADETALAGVISADGWGVSFVVVMPPADGQEGVSEGHWGAPVPVGEIEWPAPNQGVEVQDEEATGIDIAA